MEPRQLSVADWASYATILTGLLGVPSILGLYLQWRKQWLLASADMVTKLVEQFRSPEFGRQRAQCAEVLARNRAGTLGEPPMALLYPVLGFFEHVGHLVRRRALDEHMVWNKFGWEVLGYYTALTAPTNCLIWLRRDLRSHYVEFEWLHGRMLTLYRAAGDEPYRPGAPGSASLRWVDEFLDQELRLGRPEQEPVAPARAAPARPS